MKDYIYSGKIKNPTTIFTNIRDFQYTQLHYNAYTKLQTSLIGWHSHTKIAHIVAAVA